MENKNEKTTFCKKLRYGNQESPTVLLGIIVNDSNGFIEFRTARRKLMISKNSILSLEETKIIFRGEE